ncbi:MAG: FAD-dependent oxidoreductase [Bacteroidota bacterium]
MSAPPPRLAIIGAGAAGLAAAYVLRDAALAVTVFEKSRGPTGRAATRGRHGVRYDHGANYAKPERDSWAHRLLRDALPAADLVEVTNPVWPFDADGVLHPEAAHADAAPKLTYRDGLSRLGKLLADAADVSVRTETRIERLARMPNGWHLFGTDSATDGNALGTFDAVLLTPPGPQTRDLLAASDLGDAWLRDRLVEAVGQAAYTSQFALVLAFDEALDRPTKDGVTPYGLVDTSRSFPVAWLSFENDKPGHVPEGRTVLVAQMSDAWTRAHYDADRATLFDLARPHLETLLSAPLPEPAWTDTQRWRYALPTSAADLDALAGSAACGLFFAGDYLVGQGRVHRALETGRDAAEQIQRWMTSAV